MGGGVDAVVQLAEALKASKCFDILISTRLRNYLYVAKQFDTPLNSKKNSGSSVLNIPSQ